MRIDAHIHYTPPSMAENLADFTAQEPYWGLLLNPDPVNHTVQGWASAERMIADMDEAGIDKVVLQAEYRLNHSSCVERNNQALEIIKEYPNRVIAFACIQPTAGQDALDELQRCLDGGMQGVGESNPYGQGHTLDNPDFLRMVEMCIEHDLPLNLHVSEEIGHYYLGKSTTPLRHYYRLAERYPELKLILAHWGGGLFLYEIMPEVAKTLTNVWYDTAASPLLYPTAEIFDVALRCIDHRKVLFGSDYPLLIYPDKQKEPGFNLFIDEINGLGLDEQVYTDIMGENAARLLDVNEAWQIHSRPQRKSSTVITEITDTTGVAITGHMTVTMVAELWPETAAVFEKYGIPYRDTPVPYWEPIVQAAAARNFGPADQQKLIDELNEAIEKSE